MEFSGKVALITGASVGIGRATAILLAQKGAKVILLDVNYEKLQSVKEEISVCNNDVLIYKCDVSDEANVNSVILDAIEKFGRIDILVNNAALWRNFEPFEETTTEKWHTFFNINVFGTVFLSRAVTPYMKSNNYGRIINIGSVAGVYGNRNMAMYSATKGAIISFTKAIAKELAPNNILVNCVSPGTVTSSANPDITATVPSDASYLGRTGSDIENANIICFLTSDKNGYISGENVIIDGCRKNI
jgi:3-oxoacyl-[acyl-carrier protein] reductase